MGRVYRRQRIMGVTIPAVIHNVQYHWLNMAVYEDGVISCWEKSDFYDIPRQLSRGWLTPIVPEGKELDVFNCCSLEITKAKWNFDNEGYYKFIEDTVRSINPEMTNVFKTTEREKAFWEERRIGFTASPDFCKVDNENEKFGYKIVEADESNVILRNNGIILLTSMYAYKDATFSIDGLDGMFTLDDIKRMFADKTLSTAPENGETVSFSALGEAVCSVTHALDNKEKLKEIENQSLDAQGKPDAYKRCIDAYHAYLTEPSDYRKEKLREAYEAVPEHERCYLGDMDTMDSDFIRILYTDDKREV